MALNRMLSRIEKLEAAQTAPPSELVIFRLIVAPGEVPAYDRGECSGRSFERLRDESLEAFQDRIALATRPDNPTAQRGRIVLSQRADRWQT